MYSRACGYVDRSFHTPVDHCCDHTLFVCLHVYNVREWGVQNDLRTTRTIHYKIIIIIYAFDVVKLLVSI